MSIQHTEHELRFLSIRELRENLRLHGGRNPTVKSLERRLYTRRFERGIIQRVKHLSLHHHQHSIPPLEQLFPAPGAASRLG